MGTKMDDLDRKLIGAMVFFGLAFSVCIAVYATSLDKRIERLEHCDCRITLTNPQQP